MQTAGNSSKKINFNDHKLNKTLELKNLCSLEARDPQAISL